MVAIESALLISPSAVPLAAARGIEVLPRRSVMFLAAPVHAGERTRRGSSPRARGPGPRRRSGPSAGPANDGRPIISYLLANRMPRWPLLGAALHLHAPDCSTSQNGSMVIGMSRRGSSAGEVADEVVVGLGADERQLGPELHERRRLEADQVRVEDLGVRSRTRPSAVSRSSARPGPGVDLVEFVGRRGGMLLPARDRVEADRHLPVTGDAPVGMPRLGVTSRWGTSSTYFCGTRDVHKSGGSVTWVSVSMTRMSVNTPASAMSASFPLALDSRPIGRLQTPPLRLVL